jgi:hypothetical protein
LTAELAQQRGQVPLGHHEQREEGDGGIELAEVRDVAEVPVEVGAARGLRPGEVEHDRGLVDPHDLDAGVEQLPRGRQAGAAAEVEHACAGGQLRRQPLGLGHLDVPLDERLVVTLPDHVEGRGVGHPPSMPGVPRGVQPAKRLVATSDSRQKSPASRRGGSAVAGP